MLWVMDLDAAEQGWCLVIAWCLKSRLERHTYLGDGIIWKRHHWHVWLLDWDDSKAQLSWDCKREYLHVAFACGLGFLRVCDRVLGSSPRGHFLRASVLREPSRSCMALCDQGLEVLWNLLLYSDDWNCHMACPDSIGDGRGTSSLWKEWQRTLGLFN